MNCFKQIDAFFNRQPPPSGWCDIDKAITLASIVIATRPKAALELGVFAGKSAIPIALAMQDVGGTLYAVDCWDGAKSSEGYTGPNKEYWSDQKRLSDAETQFRELVKEYGLEPHVVIKRAASDAIEIPEQIGLFHCDGQHTQQAVRDVAHFAPQVPFGGIIVMDDLNWENDGRADVQKAALLLADFGFVKLYALGTGAVFARMQ